MPQPQQSPFPLLIAKHLPTPDSRRRYKRQCLKQKNILEETSEIQIGCKIEKLYDFYTSKNYIQINLFIGNKTKQVLTNYDIAFRGTPNIELYLEEKNERMVKENTQAKERVIIEWLGEEKNKNGDEEEYSHEIMLTFSFTSPLLTVKDTAIPLSVWSFCHFLPYELPNVTKVLPLQENNNYNQLLKQIKQSYELIEEQEIEVNELLFKKGQLFKEIEKYFDRLNKIELESSSESSSVSGNNINKTTHCYYGLFTMKSLVEEHFIILNVNNNNNNSEEEKIMMRIILAGNEYKYFEAIFNCLKLLLGK